MVDFKKELTFSDLIPKRKTKTRKPSKKAVSAPTRRTVPADLVGLKIEARSLTAAHVVNNGSKKLMRIARAPLAEGIVNGGEVRDPAALATALTEFFKENDLPRRGVRLGLANSRIGVRVVEVTGITDTKMLDNAVGFRAHEFISAPLDEVVLDYHVLDTSTGETGEISYRVLLVIAYRDSVDRYLAATDAASLELAGIDLDAFALLRASVRGVDEVGTAPSALVAVSIDHDLTTLAISDGVACQLTRVLEWGTANVDAALHRSLRVPAEEAEAIRSRVSFEAPADPSAFSQPGPPQPAEVVARELQTLVRELQSSIRFYGSQPAAAPVTALIVSGTLVDIPGFARRLSADLGIEVTAADPYARVEITAGLVRPELSGGLVVAVGLGIEV